MPDYLTAALALLVSAIGALALAIVAAFTLASVLERLHHYSDALGDGIFAFFFAAPSIAIFSFVACFTLLMNWHHVASWRAPTFAFVLGTILVWMWARDFGGIGFVRHLPGISAWLVSSWLLHRKMSTPSQHVIEA